MSNNKDDSISYDVKFVIPKNKSCSEVSEIMKTAFEAMECNCLEPMWITQEECLQFKEKQSKLFICDPFGDEAFQHLSSLKCRILGSLCILSCLQNGHSLPLRPYPVYSVTMRGISVTCSNVDKTTREEIAEKIQLMGGIYNKDLTQSVTHLIIDSVGSAKYHVASRIGLPVMLPGWVNDCWNNGQYQQLHASDSSYNRYCCPVFKGLCITVSQLTNEERKTAQQAIEQNGGSYSGQMRANVTTHLVLIQPKGDKYKFGKTWKIKCVKLSWLYESIEAGYSKEETQYQLDKSCEPDLHTSTPEKNSIVHKLGQLGDCSSISNISVIPHRESRIDETANSDISIIHEPYAKDFFSFHLLDKLSDISNVGQFLDGCRIFICGFSGTRLEKLRKIINAGYGMRFNKMGENITHVILGEKNNDILKYASECSTKPHVVSYLWLLNCYKEQKLLDEQPYQYITNNVTSQAYSSNIGHVSHLNEFSTFQTEQNENNKDTSNDVKNTVNQINCADDINSNKVSPPGVINEIHIATKAHISLQDENAKYEGCLLLGFTVLVDGFGPKDTDLIEQMVKSEGGKMVTGQIADFCIAPIIGSNVMTTPEVNVVTNCWLQMCIEQEMLLPSDSNPLFKPLSVKQGSLILKDCILSFSQYTGTERDCLTHLAEEMGAHCQEYFVRKASKSRKLLPNTHLVVATPEGSKYEAAKKWNIPAVTKDWLFASVYKGKKANEEEYLVDFQVSAKDSALNAIQMANVTNLSESINNTSNKQVSNIKVDLLAENEVNLSINGITNKNINNIIISEANITKSGSESTPSKFLNPDVSFHPDYEVNSLLSMLDNSNTTGGHTRKSSLPMQDLFAVNISKALKNIGVDENTSDNQEHTSDNAPKDNFKENFKPLQNIIVCVSKKLVGKQSELNNIIMLLGGECQWNYSSTCTHFVCQGKSGALSRELKLAQEEMKKIVSPEWIYACHASFSHVDESLYPYTHNPRLSLLGQVSSKKIHGAESPNKSNISTNSSKIHNADSLNKLNVSTNAVIDQLPLNVNNLNSRYQSQMTEKKCEQEESNEKVIAGAITKELEDLLNVTKVRTEKANSSSPNSKLTNFADVSVCNFKKKFDSSHGAERNFKSNEPSGKVETVLPESETQSVPIAWDDPTGRSERERLAQHVNQTVLNDEFNNDFQNIGSPEKQINKLDWNGQITSASDFDSIFGVTDNAGNLQKLEKQENISEVIHKFMFSGLSDNEKDRYTNVIKNLGGKISTSKSFDGKATHLILGQPLKNEKFLGSVASGLWVLHKTYVDACEKAGHFVDELFHEWGGPMTYRLESTLPDKLNKVAMCPSRWRGKIHERRKNSKNMKCGAFQDWKVLIFAEKQKYATYSRILENGGAEIIPSLSTSNSRDITHAFIEIKSQRDMNKINLESLVSSGISCLKPEYLAFYLIEPVVPIEEKFIIPEALELIDRISKEKKRKCEESAAVPAKRHQYSR